MDAMVIGVGRIFHRGGIPSIELQKAEKEDEQPPKSGIKRSYLRLGQRLRMGWGHVSPEQQERTRSGRYVTALLSGKWGEAPPC